MAVVTKSITTDFSGSFDMHIFYREIEADTGLALRTLNWIRTDGDVVSTDFDQALDAGEVIAFDAVVAAHPSFTVYEGEQRKTITANVPPTTSDDATELIDVGDLWINQLSSKSYVCTDNTAGAAIWMLLAPEAGAATVHAVDPTNLDDTGAGYAVGDAWINTASGNAFVLVDGTNDAAVWRPLTPHVMGGFIVKGEALAVTTTNNTNFIEKLSLAVPATIEAGSYVLSYHYQWNIASTAQNFEARIQLDDTTLLFNHVEEATDRTGNYANTGSGQQMPVSGIKFITLTAASHTIDLDFKAPAQNIPVSMWNAQMFLQRISGDPVS